MTRLLLVGHGSRDPAALDEFWQVAAAAGAAGCFLEFAQPTLPQALARLDGQVTVVPLTLFPAGHTVTDIPRLMAEAARPGLSFRYSGHLGLHPLIVAVVEERAREAGGAELILVARGASVPEANADLFRLAQRLGAHPCFCGLAQPDYLETLHSLGGHAFVLPYFLFTGVLIERMRRQAAAVGARFGRHIGPDPRLVQAILDKAGGAPPWPAASSTWSAPAPATRN